MRKRIYCNRPSRSAVLLGREMGIRRIKREGSRYRERDGDIIINWGCSSIPFTQATVLNRNSYIASNKLLAFQQMQEQGFSHIPFFTSSYDEAVERISGKCVARTLLSSHSGRGIEIVEDVRELEGRDDVLLFLPYIKKKHEYRVHVGKIGQSYLVLDMQQKRKRRETPNEDVNYQVRNHGNGWIYAREMEENTDVEQLSFIAERAVSSLGLDWGAVDVVYNSYYNSYYVLEVNTAVGLENTTLRNYSDFLLSLISYINT